MINQMIFPAPCPPSYDASTVSPHKLIHIPRPATSATVESPFTLGLFISCPASPFLILYAHPNAVDVGQMVEEMEFISRRTQCNILLWEYQGYGLLQDHEEILGARHDFAEPGEEALNEDISAVYAYCLHELRIPSSQIVLMGRSIGTGPSVWLASQCRSGDTGAATARPPPLAVFLQAPFTSIVDCCKTVARQRLNLTFAESLASLVVADRFRNVDAVPNIPCPVWIQHGDLDDIVHISHSVALVDAARMRGKNDVVLFPSEGYHHNNLSASETARLLTNLIRKTVGQWSPAELRLKPSEFHLAHPPLSATLLRSEAKRVSLVSEVLRNAASYWTQSTTYGTTGGLSGSSAAGEVVVSALVSSRARLMELLLVNVCVFTCRLARLWQQTVRVLQRQRERLQRNNQSSIRKGVAWLRSTLSSPSTIATTGTPQQRVAVDTAASQAFSGNVLQMLEQLIAVRGSPFGVYQYTFPPAEQQQTTAAATFSRTLRLMDLVVRRSYGTRGSESSVRDLLVKPTTVEFFATATNSLDAAARAVGPQCETVVELHWPNFLLRDVVAMVESAPDVLAAGVGSTEDPFFFLTSGHVDRLQRQVERFVGFLPDTEWAHLQHQIRALLGSTVHHSAEGNLARANVLQLTESLSLQQVEDRAASFAKRDKPATAAEYDSLLSEVRRQSTSDGLLRHVAGEGVEVVLLDPSWITAWHLHREFVAAARHEGTEGQLLATGARSSAASSGPDSAERHLQHPRSRKADDDCCVM